MITTSEKLFNTIPKVLKQGRVPQAHLFTGTVYRRLTEIDGVGFEGLD